MRNFLGIPVAENQEIECFRRLNENYVTIHSNLIGDARVSTYGQILDARPDLLPAVGSGNRNIHRKKVTGGAVEIDFYGEMTSNVSIVRLLKPRPPPLEPRRAAGCCRFSLSISELAYENQDQLSAGGQRPLLPAKNSRLPLHRSPRVNVHLEKI